ncbi:preprotein translocase subunit SecG [bacterium]|nr:preprotein translocase subunit SecG [bacterium]
MLVGLLTALLVFVSVVLIVLIVALQHGNEGGIGSAFGGGNSAGFFGASGGVALIVRATWIFGTAFFCLSTALAWVKTHEKFAVGRELDSALSVTPTPGSAAGSATAAPSPAAVSTPASAASPASGVTSPAPAVTPASDATPASGASPAASGAAPVPAAATPAAPAQAPAK